MAFDPTQPELKFALDAVREAALLARRIRAEMAVEGLEKGDLSPVTVGDFAGQALVARSLEAAFPADVLVGEEKADVLKTVAGRPILDLLVKYLGQCYPGTTAEEICRWIDRGAAEPRARFWTLDPIDGTKGYLRGDQYATALALIEGGQAQVGALACPGLDSACRPAEGGEGMVLAAVRGQGTWGTELVGEDAFRRLHVSPVGDPKHARVLRSYEAGHTNAGLIEDVVAELGIEAEPVRMDSQAKYAVLAAGGGELLFRLLSPKRPDYRECIWDQAAGSIVLEEAGGRITDLDGRPLNFTTGRKLTHNRGICASNGALHDAALAALKKVGATSAG
jgi:3'(2'), 5'-bisphosphate nucleotidase